MARTPWRIHLWAWDLAERCFSSLCEMVKKFELKKFELKKKIELKKIWKIFFSVQTYVKPNLVFSKISFMLGGSKNQSGSEWHETWSRFGIFEIRWNFQNGWGGGGLSKNQSCSEWRETWSRLGIFEIRWNFRNLGGRGNKTKMFLSSSWVQIWKNSLF